MKNILFAIFIICSTIAPGQNKNTFIDMRDSMTYHTIIIDSLEWMTDNLNYKIEGALKHPEPCDSCGLLYTYKVAEKICPEGFRLPTENEWHKLFETLGGRKTTDPKRGTFFYGIKKKLLNESVLLRYCGYARQNPFSEKIDIEISMCGIYGAYWHKNDNAFYGIHFEKIKCSTWIGTVEGDLQSGFSVRCVRFTK